MSSRKEYMKEYFKKNKEKIYKKRAENPKMSEIMRIATRKYYAKHKERIKEKAKTRYAKKKLNGIVK